MRGPPELQAQEIRNLESLYGASLEQWEALVKVHRRQLTNKPSFLAFVAGAHYQAGINCVMVPWGGMILGIERDGYTHS